MYLCKFQPNLLIKLKYILNSIYIDIYMQY